MATTPHFWRTTPRRSILIFLLAVFCIFSSFGFATDAVDMGRQPSLRFAISVALSGLFAVCYALTGITMRGRSWKAIGPLVVLQFLCMSLLGNLLPGGSRLVQFDAVATTHLQSRLTFDGIAIIISVCLGYAGFVHVSISEGRRHIRVQTEKATLDGEMVAAREVQRVMVPEDLPAIAGYAIENIYLPAAEVGGDFFQVIPLKSGRTLLVIGDVSGKGLRAAMIVSMIVGALHTVSGYTEDPAEILGELNRRLYHSMHEGFATCLAVRLEDAGALTLSNAGHVPPYVNGNEVQFSGSLPLGIAANTTYDRTTLQMTAGDVFVLLTDGVAEALDEKNVLLGFPKVESMLRAGASAKAVAETAQHHGQSDDITVLRITRLA